MGQRGVAADAGADFLELLVAGLGDVHRHLAALALVGALGLGHHQQPAGVRGQGAVDDDDVLAQVRRRRRAGRVDGAPGFFLFANGLAAGALGGQGLDQAQLAVAQVVGARFRRGVLGGLHQRRLRKAGARLPLEPVVAGAEHEVPVAAPLRPRLALVGAGHLGQGAAAQVADEHVAVAHEGHAAAGGVIGGQRAVESCARGTVHALGGAAVHGDLPGVADVLAFPLEVVLDALAVPRPPGRLDRRADPVRVRHGLVQGDRGRAGAAGGLRERARGGAQEQGECKEAGAHLGYRDYGKPAEGSSVEPAGSRAVGHAAGLAVFALPRVLGILFHSPAAQYPMHAYVYKSLRKDDTYVFLAARDAFDRIPAAVRESLGRLESVLEVELHPGRRLARADAGQVMEALDSRGFYLQVPPRPELDPLTEDWGTDA